MRIGLMRPCMSKQCLFMSTQNLATFYTLSINNFLSKHSVSMKLSLIVQLTNGNSDSSLLFKNQYKDFRHRIVQPVEAIANSKRPV